MPVNNDQRWKFSATFSRRIHDRRHPHPELRCVADPLGHDARSRLKPPVIFYGKSRQGIGDKQCVTDCRPPSSRLLGRKPAAAYLIVHRALAHRRKHVVPDLDWIGARYDYLAGQCVPVIKRAAGQEARTRGTGSVRLRTSVIELYIVQLSVFSGVATDHHHDLIVAVNHDVFNRVRRPFSTVFRSVPGRALLHAINIQAKPASAVFFVKVSDVDIITPVVRRIGLIEGRAYASGGYTRKSDTEPVGCASIVAVFHRIVVQSPEVLSLNSHVFPRVCRRRNLLIIEQTFQFGEVSILVSC